MKRLFPFPLLSLSLALMWLLLQGELSAGHALLAVVLGILGPLAMSTLDLPAASLRRPRAIMKLLMLVLDDVFRSNWAVMMIIWSPKMRGQTSGFVDIPLALRSPYALTMLAIIITATPGTLWAGYDPKTGIMRLHVLDLIDESAWAQRIKQRYETLLQEIFE